MTNSSKNTYALQQQLASTHKRTHSRSGSGSDGSECKSVWKENLMIGIYSHSHRRWLHMSDDKSEFSDGMSESSNCSIRMRM